MSRLRRLPGNGRTQAERPVKQRDECVRQRLGDSEAVDLSAAIDTRQDCSAEFRLSLTDFDRPLFTNGLVNGFDDADVEQSFLGGYLAQW